MRRNIEKNENEFSKKKKIIFCIALITVLSIGIFGISVWHKSTKNTVKELLYSYSEKRDVDYIVNIYQNNFIDSNFLSSGQTYISDLVKDIETTFEYSLSGSKKINAKCTYKVIATINGVYQANSNSEEENVWSKDYVVLEEKTKDFSEVINLKLDESVKIDYDFYNNEVSEFRKKLKLPITSELSVKMYITTKFSTLENKVQESKESVLELKIPLNTQAFNIKTNFKEKNKDTVVEYEDKTQKIGIGILGILLIILDVIVFAYYYAEIFGLKIKSEYEKKIGKILKNYGDVIIEVDSDIDMTNCKIMDVINFNEIVDLEEELRIPILFYEAPDRSEGIFCLLHGEIMYRYILRAKKNRVRNIQAKQRSTRRAENSVTKRRR